MDGREKEKVTVADDDDSAKRTDKQEDPGEGARVSSDIR